MRKLLLLITIFLLVAACGKEEVPVQQSPVAVAPPVYVPPPEPAVIPPSPEPVQPPVATQPEPEPLPAPVQEVPSGRQSCQVLTKIGKLYFLDDVKSGKISAQNFYDFNVCYPYFAPDQANTESMCCII